MATKLNLITFSHCADNAFTTRGFRNWKHAHEKFKSHAVTSHHKEAAMKFANYVGGKSISAEMHNSLQTEQAQHRQALLQLFSTLRFLARQGLSVQGHTDAGSNYHQLLELRAADSDALQILMASSKKNKWISRDIQNEMLESLSNTLLRELSSDTRAHEFFSLIVDEPQIFQHLNK